MHHKITALALTFLFACSAQAEAFPQKKDFSHDFTVGLESFHYHYDETINKKKFMDIKGLEFGLNGAYQVTYKDAFFIRPEARVTYGFTEYSNAGGSVQDAHHIPDFLFETRLLTGWQFHLNKQFMIVPYTGIAYRQKENDGSDGKSKANLSGLKRINKLWYVPLGLKAQYDFNNRWFIQGMAEYDWMLKGEQLTYSVHKYPSPLVCNQKKGFGLKGEILAGYHFDKVSVSAGPYAHYWNIEKTKKVAYKSQADGFTFDGEAYEPKNSTKEIGLKVNFTF